MIMNTPSTTLFIIRTMFRVLQMNSVQLGPSPQTISKFLCFLVSSGIWMTNRGWSERAESQVSVLLRSAPRVTIWSNEKAYIWAAEAPNRPAVSEGVLVSIQDNQYTLSFLSPCLPTFTRFHSSALPPPPPPFGLWLGLGRASTSLGVLAGGALCLGGWGGPRVSFWWNKKKKYMYLWSTPKQW